MIDALERTEIVLWHRRAASDQYHRHAFELCVGDRSHTIGDARPRSRERDADLAGQHGVAVRHVHSGAFVANIKDADVALNQVIPDWLDVATLQPINAINAPRNYEFGDPLGDRTSGICTHLNTSTREETGGGRVPSGPRRQGH